MTYLIIEIMDMTNITKCVDVALNFHYVKFSLLFIMMKWVNWGYITSVVCAIHVSIFWNVNSIVYTLFYIKIM